jgi:hypothetical protein
MSSWIEVAVRRALQAEALEAQEEEGEKGKR